MSEVLGLAQLHCHATGMTASNSRFASLLLILLAACGGGDSTGADGGEPATDANDTPSVDANEESWAPLVMGSWTLPAGGEDTSDTHQIVLDRDIYIGAIRPIEPIGTHHTVLSIAGGSGVVYASGVGTNAVTFPEGVGLKLAAGTRLNLELHIFNTGAEPISGTSGIEIVEIAEADVVQEADLFLPGPFGFQLAPGQETTATGTCAIETEQTVFALFPHMHQLGKHFKLTVNKGGQDQVVHDAPYDFDEQAFNVFEPITLSPGDSITSECTWMNTTGQTVRWGDSSTSEMCFGIMYRYPAVGDDFCDNGFTP